MENTETWQQRTLEETYALQCNAIDIKLKICLRDSELVGPELENFSRLISRLIVCAETKICFLRQTILCARAASVCATHTARLVFFVLLNRTAPAFGSVLVDKKKTDDVWLGCRRATRVT